MPKGLRCRWRVDHFQQDGLTAKLLSQRLTDLLSPGPTLNNAAKCAAHMGKPEAAGKLADLVVSVMSTNENGGINGQTEVAVMKEMPLSIGTIHFVGIGGIGMSGIAEVMQNFGYTVQGSDIAAGANVKRLEYLGISVAIGHAAENVANADVVVISSAVKPDNPEVVAARSKLVPVVRRAEMLAGLMRLKWAVAVCRRSDLTEDHDDIADFHNSEHCGL